MQHPLTGAPLNYSIQSREQWDDMIRTAEFVSKKLAWSVGIWLDTRTWGVQFFAGAGSLQARAGFRAMIRLTPWQEVRPEVSDAVWERYHTEHAIFLATRGRVRTVGGGKSFEEEFAEEQAAAPEKRKPGRPRRLTGSDAMAAESTNYVGRRMAAGLAALGDDEPEPAGGGAGGKKAARKSTEEDPF